MSAFSAVAATVSLSFSNFWIASLMLVAFAISARQMCSGLCRDTYQRLAKDQVVSGPFSNISSS